MKRTSIIAKVLLSMLLLAMVLICFGCEKQVNYVPLPQLEIPEGYMSQKEKDMIHLVNQYRLQNGLSPYKTSLHLYHLAKSRVYYMFENDTLSHYGFYPAYVESGALFYGESISANYISATENVEGFHDSENHWPMFMSPVYEYVAIACYDKYTVVLAARWRPYRVDGPNKTNVLTYIDPDKKLITSQIKK